MNEQEYFFKLRELIKIHGFTLIGVFDDVGNDPSFVYSIGLTEMGWPELLLIGDINPMFLEIIMTEVVDHFRKVGSVVPGDIGGIITGGYDLRVIEVDSAVAGAKYGCQVKNFYPGRDIKFMQVLWPDKAGVFPNEEGYDNERPQPVVPAPVKH